MYKYTQIRNTKKKKTVKISDTANIKVDNTEGKCCKTSSTY